MFQVKQKIFSNLQIGIGIIALEQLSTKRESLKVGNIMVNLKMENPTGKQRPINKMGINMLEIIEMEKKMERELFIF